MLHRRLTPFGREDTSVGNHAVQMMDRRHMVLVVLVECLGPTGPPQRHVLRYDRAAEIRVLAAVADITGIETAQLFESLGAKSEIEGPEAAIIAASSYHAGWRASPFRMFDRDLLEALEIDSAIRSALRQISNLAHPHAFALFGYGGIILDQVGRRYAVDIQKDEKIAFRGGCSDISGLGKTDTGVAEHNLPYGKTG